MFSFFKKTGKPSARRIEFIKTHADMLAQIAWLTKSAITQNTLIEDQAATIRTLEQRVSLLAARSGLLEEKA